MIIAIDEFIPSWLEGELKKLDPADRKQFLTEYEEVVRDALQRLETAPVNRYRDGTEEGHFSLRLGSTDLFLNVKKAVWTAAKYAGPLILVAAVSPALLTHLGLSAGTVPHVTAGTTGSAVVGPLAGERNRGADIRYRYDYATSCVGPDCWTLGASSNG